MKDFRTPTLIALLFTVTAELLRAGGPLLDGLAGAVGIPISAAVAIGLFVLPGALLVTLRRASLTGMILLLLVVRLTAQVAPNLPLVVAGAIIAMVCLALAMQRAADPAGAITGVLAGCAVDLGIRSATMSWDLIWTGLWGLPVVLMLAGAFWFSLFTVEPDRPKLGRAWSVGAYLALWTMVLGNPAFLSSASGVQLQVALFAMILGVLVSIELARRIALLPFAGPLYGAGLVGGVVAAWWGAGWTVVAGVVAAQLFAAVCLARAISTPMQRGNAVYGLMWLLPVLLYQVHYERPLPFDNRYLIVAVAVLLALAGLRRRRAEAPEPIAAEPEAEPAVALPPGMLQIRSPLPRPFLPATHGLALLLLVPLGFLTITPSDARAEGTPGLRLMSWNVKYGRDDASGGMNPAQIAAAIREQRADLVVLQEVSRGWVIGGGTDLAEYLRRELGMAAYFAPAADGQFGNLVLAPKSSRLEVEHHFLPYGQGPMWRSYLEIRTAGFSIIATHLAHYKKNTPTRLRQIETILQEKPDVVVGDLNFWPTWQERRLFVSAGYFSAQDEKGEPAAFTAPTGRPTNRVDWVWVGRRLEVASFEILKDVKASDHFPVVATLSAPALSS